MVRARQAGVLNRRAALAVTVAVGFCAHSAHAADPQVSYMLNCMGCHVADGSGAPGKVPSVRDSLAKLAVTAEGRAYLVQVPGASQSALSNVELAQVLNWMIDTLSAKPVPAGTPAYSAQEVARYRSNPLTQVARTRAKLLADTIPPRGAPESIE